jgi:hypothetical protein
VAWCLCGEKENATKAPGHQESPGFKELTLSGKVQQFQNNNYHKMLAL